MYVEKNHFFSYSSYIFSYIYDEYIDKFPIFLSLTMGLLEHFFVKIFILGYASTLS